MNITIATGSRHSNFVRCDSCVNSNRRLLGKWRPGNMAAVLASMLVCALRPTIDPDRSACCANALVRSSLSNGCAKSIPNIWSMRASSLAPAAALAGAKDEASLPTATVPNMPDEVADEPAHLKAARYVWALPLADRVILQLDQAAPQDQKLPRHHRECRENLNLDRHMRLRPHRDRQKAPRPERQPLHNPTARQRHRIRENPY